MDLLPRIREKLKGLLPDLIGLELAEVSPDRVRATLKVRADLCTTGGVLHGGSIMAFADTLGAIGTIANLPEGASTTTIAAASLVGG